MKVTAILPDNLISEIKKLSHGKNITESLKIALNEWVYTQHLKHLNSEIKRKPLTFKYSSEDIRKLNRL